jgi:hypothetical protein
LHCVDGMAVSWVLHILHSMAGFSGMDGWVNSLCPFCDCLENMRKCYWCGT